MTSCVHAGWQYVPVTVFSWALCGTQVKTRRTTATMPFNLVWEEKASGYQTAGGTLQEERRDICRLRKCRLMSRNTKSGQTVPLDFSRLAKRSMSSDDQRARVFRCHQAPRLPWGEKTHGSQSYRIPDRLAVVPGRPKLSEGKRCRVIMGTIAQRFAILKSLIFDRKKICHDQRGCPGHRIAVMVNKLKV